MTNVRELEVNPLIRKMQQYMAATIEAAAQEIRNACCLSRIYSADSGDGPFILDRGMLMRHLQQLLVAGQRDDYATLAGGVQKLADRILFWWTQCARKPELMRTFVEGRAMESGQRSRTMFRRAIAGTSRIAV